jgi:YHS domain-containing protein
MSTSGERKLQIQMDFLASIMRYLLRKGLRWMLRRAVGPGGEFGSASSVNVNATGNEVRAESTGPAARKLVRDPVCGVYVAEVLAIPLRENGELVYFCSTACRDKYAVQIERRAANS